MVFVPIESGRRHPVLGRELVRIAHTEAPLLRRVDEEEAAKRPEGLPAQPGLRFLFEQEDAAARVSELGGRYQSSEACPHHDHISVRHSLWDYAR
jgi:hypothetical protein